MVYAPHLRVTCSGILGGASGTGAGFVEQFSFGFAMAGGAGLPEPAAPANGQLMTDLVADVAAFFARPATKIGQSAILTTVKVASIGADGLYVSDPFIGETLTPGGSGFGLVNPPQVAMAVSLVTDRRGPSGQGRFFLPLPAISVTPSTMTVPEADADSVRGSAATLLEDLANLPGIDAFPALRVVVASSKGYNSGVTAVRVGRALDTVRSRRASLEEQYSGPQTIVI